MDNNATHLWNKNHLNVCYVGDVSAKIREGDTDRIFTMPNT